MIFSSFLEIAILLKTLMIIFIWMIGIISGKIRFAANMIIVHGRFFSVKDKCLLFNGWIRGAIHANSLVFLPFLKKGEIDDLQSAMNAGIRAVMGLRRF